MIQFVFKGTLTEASGEIDITKTEDYAICEAIADDILGIAVPYTQIKYIESNGGQYIDTGVAPNNFTIVEAKFNLLSYNQLNSILGVRGANTDNFYMMFDSTGKTYVGAGNDVTAYDVDDMTLGEHTLKMTTGELDFGFDMTGSGSTIHPYFQYALDGNAQGLNVNNINTTKSIYLFSCNYTESITNSNIQLSYCKIYDHDVLVRSFIPVLDKQKIPCLYDEVTGEFFYNKGTGNFIAGGAL